MYQIIFKFYFQKNFTEFISKVKNKNPNQTFEENAIAMAKSFYVMFLETKFQAAPTNYAYS